MHGCTYLGYVRRVLLLPRYVWMGRAVDMHGHTLVKIDTELSNHYDLMAQPRLHGQHGGGGTFTPSLRATKHFRGDDDMLLCLTPDFLRYYIMYVPIM